MKRVIKAGLAGALTLTLLATQAFAANRTTTAAGAGCLPDTETDDYFRNSTGFTLNSGADVHCPVFLDSATTTIADTDVYVDLPVSTSVTCFLTVISNTGSVIDSDTGTTSVDTAGADVDFVSISAGTGVNDTVSLRCTLPDGGRIISYTVNED
jgi:hypothetical protein